MKPLNDILVADDNADDVFLLRQAFRRAGVDTRLSAVSDGLELWWYLEGKDGYADREAHPWPDLVLLDLNMPRLGGFDVLQRLRADERFRGMIIHVVTASAREADVRRAYELHANSYITKPTRIDELSVFVKALHDWHRFAWAPRAPLPAALLRPTGALSG